MVKIWCRVVLLFILAVVCSGRLIAQKTKIRGFAAVNLQSTDNKSSFNLGETDLFITSQLSSRISFLGEIVFKYDAISSTHFGVGVERMIIKYNYLGNHNILIGKGHTPLNYWNDSYHHGRVFFPTCFRPETFNANIIPIHTIGIWFQGANLGKPKFGYDIMVGNGIGSPDAVDNDENKSLTVAIHIKPANGLRISASGYFDRISEGTQRPGDSGTTIEPIDQQLYTASVAYFEKNFEFLSEWTLAMNKTDSLGQKQTYSGYAYGGYRIKKIVPYIRYDFLETEDQEMYFLANKTNMFSVGLRYEFNFLAVAKIEYLHKMSDQGGIKDLINFQFAIGF